MAAEAPGPPPRPPHTGDAVLDDYLMDVYRWLWKVYIKLGKFTEPAEIDIAGTAAVATQADSVPTLDVSGDPDGAVEAQPGTIATDVNSGNKYIKTVGSDNAGWHPI